MERPRFYICFRWISLTLGSVIAMCNCMYTRSTYCMFTRSMYSVLSYTPYMYLLSIICLTTSVREVCPGAHVTKMLYSSVSLLVCSWVTFELKIGCDRFYV